MSKIDIRSGTVTKVETFSGALKPAYKIWIDFLPLDRFPSFGVMQTSAQVTEHYETDYLIGKSVIDCVNIGEKNVAGFTSQFLLLGFSDNEDKISIVGPDHKIPDGQKLH